MNAIPFVTATMLATSAGFAMPLGYQINKMIFRPPRCRFNDYVKIGVPLDILIMIVTLVLSPFIGPF